MTSDKKNISLLVDIFIKSGLSNIVISPGSRNAPIILSFANNPQINATSIVDERSAAFFALGQAIKTKKTVAIACTSGSAVLNYASAISEAYYQKIPLLILTADRPEYLIDVGDGQTIRQQNVFSNYIKSSFQLPLDIDSKEDFSDAERIINEALYCCMEPQPGPVHINIPFDEPIYNTTNEQVSGKVINLKDDSNTNSRSKIEEAVKQYNSSKKVMIIAAQNRPNDDLNDLLIKISEQNNTIILTETTSNIHHINFIDTIDNVINSITETDISDFKPDMVISFGGQIVSKKIKKFLRKNKPETHYNISSSGESMDTFFSLTNTIVCSEVNFFETLVQNMVTVSSNYNGLWYNRKYEIDIWKANFLLNCPYSDLKVFNEILNNLPKNTVLHLGNSTPVRYSQLFGSMPHTECNSNRGVSGIDGQVSTAAGYAYLSDKLNLLITGDLGFLYDSNGLMNHHLVPNFKIIIINNSGGGIFRFIPGPDTTPNLEEFFEVKHNWKAEFICKAFDIDYVKAESIDEIQGILPSFLVDRKSVTVLEIFTPQNENGEVLREYFNFISRSKTHND